jgi:hypothetical protein
MEYENKYPDFSVLKGKVLKEVTENGDEMKFVTVDDEVYTLYHSQDCCESVSIESIVGDLNDLVGSEILLAEEALGDTPADTEREFYESYTWTFYKLATIKGYVDVRWLGESNGYYSESVTFEQVK